MHPILAKTIEHIRTKHADRGNDLPAVIQDCAAAGFAPGFIIEGLKTVFQIPHREAKHLVMSHFFRGDDRTELERLHSELESAFTNDKPE